jgi:glycosyltransferase involved in cell wall biosynthesis
MKDWINYIKSNIHSGSWGAIFLDYYLYQKKTKHIISESEFIDSEIPKFYLEDEIDLVKFHRTLLFICIQMLGNRHKEIISKSISFLQYFKKKLEGDIYFNLIENIYKQYDEFGWCPEIVREIEKKRLGVNIKPVGALENIDNKSLPKKHSKAVDKELTILCIATEWFSKHGGLSTFNRQLCISLSEEVKHVFCLMPEFTGEEYDNANLSGVSLISAPDLKGVASISRLNSRPTLPDNLSPDILIGHDRITGPAMLALLKDHFPSAKTVLFIHTSPGEIEWYKNPGQNESISEKAESREKLQLDLVKGSNLIAAVGPKLVNEIRSQVSGLSTNHHTFRFDPGLFEDPDRSDNSISNPIYECLLLGRMEDYELKGVDIAAKSMDKVFENWKGKNKLRLVIRGAAKGMGDALKRKLDDICKSGLEIRVKEYSSNEEDLKEDIRRSSLILMPSRTEGFGLVGLEAISLRRPILLSNNSGLSQLIDEFSPAEIIYCSLPVSGNEQNVISEWAKEIEFILKDRDAAVRRLNGIIKNFSSKVSWSESVKKLLVAINE